MVFRRLLLLLAVHDICAPPTLIHCVVRCMTAFSPINCKAINSLTGGKLGSNNSLLHKDKYAIPSVCFVVMRGQYTDVYDKNIFI